MGPFSLLCLSDDHSPHTMLYQMVKEAFGNDVSFLFAKADVAELLSLSKKEKPAIVMVDRTDPVLLERIAAVFPFASVLLVVDGPDKAILQLLEEEKIDDYLQEPGDAIQLHFTIHSLLDAHRHGLELHSFLNEKRNRAADIVRERKKMVQAFRQQTEQIINENRELKKELARHIKAEAACKAVREEDEKLKRTNRRLYQQIKSLTNQISLKNILNIEIERSKRKQRDLTLMILSIDRFSDLEHDDNELARDIGTRFKAMLSSNLRITDFISHVTHGHYNVIMTETDSQGARHFVERFDRELLSGWSQSDGMKLTVSYGITSFAEEDTVEQMIKRAENALSKAKNNGKSNIVCLPEPTAPQDNPPPTVPASS